MSARLLFALRSSIFYSLIVGGFNFAAQVIFARRLGLDVVSAYVMILIVTQVVSLALSTGVNHAIIALGAKQEYLRAGWVLQFLIIISASIALVGCTFIVGSAFDGSFVAKHAGLLWLMMAGNMAFLAAHVINVDVEYRLEYSKLYRIRFIASIAANICGVAMTLADASVLPIVLRDFLLGGLYLALSLVFASPTTRQQLRLTARWDDIALVMKVARGNWGINLIGASVTRLDYWLVALALGHPFIGIYYQMRALVDGVLATALTLIQSVLFSYFSSEGEGSGEILLTPRALAATFGAALLAMSFAAVFGHFIVDVILGPQWTPGAAVLIGLAGYSVLRSCTEVLISLAKSKHLQRKVLESQLAGIAVQLVAIPSLIWAWSLIGAGLACALAAAVVLSDLYRRLVRDVRWKTAAA